MYNHVEHGEKSTRRRLLGRTRAFHDSTEIDDPESLQQFRSRWEDGADDKLLSGLPSCPFLGFVDADDDSDDEPGRVGCLVHPLQNDGVDGRDCGVYDRFICEDYLCAAHDILRAPEVRLVLDAVDDSYLYGLIVTNPRFVRKLLDIVARRTGRWPSEKVLQKASVIEAAEACFEQLRDWPHRAEDGIFGQICVAGALDTKRRTMPADDFDVEERPIDVLLVCMGTECESVEVLTEARTQLEQVVDDLAAAVERESF